MAWSLIVSREESRQAFETARRSFARNASVYRNHAVGWQGGSGSFDVFWHQDVGIWGVFQPEAPLEKGPGRFWNCFGVDHPAKHSMLSITVETNPPLEGANRRVGGAFLRDGAGRVWLAHTGKVGGGRPGIGQANFRKFCADADFICVPERRTEMFLLTPVDAEDIAERMSRYTREVSRFKSSIREVA